MLIALKFPTHPLPLFYAKIFPSLLLVLQMFLVSFPLESLRFILNIHIHSLDAITTTPPANVIIHWYLHLFSPTQTNIMFIPQDDIPPNGQGCSGPNSD